MAAPAPHAPFISLVVPVLHDTAAVAALLAESPPGPRPAWAPQRGAPTGGCLARDEWIVVNGDAADRSLDPVRASHPEVRWLDSGPGRGVQISTGAAAARGEWLLVLHADTRLPAGWRDEVTRAAASASYHWGCFRLRLDTSAWQARLIEGAVGWRVLLFRLPYGDQAMFFRRSMLEQLGGVPRVPLMEDVVLARRFGRRGPPYRSALPVTTSARRWERDGWWRRTGRNWWMLTRYLLGASPDRLASAYAPEGAAPRGASTAGSEQC